MSEESGNGRGVFFLFYVVVPVLYFVLRIFPYLCFYVLPFAVASPSYRRRLGFWLSGRVHGV